MYFYHLCGINLASEIELPELRAMRADSIQSPDVEFLIGKAEEIAEPSFSSGHYQFGGEHDFWHAIPGCARFRISDGKRILIEPDPAASEVHVRSILIGQLQAVLWFQRGQLALHASAVLHAGRAICISGVSGAGKSVLTALLAERGNPVLADDICVLGTNRERAEVLPGYASLRLWDDIADQIAGISKIAPAMIVDGANHEVNDGKSIVDLGDQAYLPASAPVSDLLLLNERAEAFSISACNEFQMLQRWSEMVHHPRTARPMGRMKHALRQLHAMMASGTRVWSVTFPDDFNATRQAVDRLLEVIDPA